MEYSRSGPYGRDEVPPRFGSGAPRVKSLGRRVFRSLVFFLVAALIGVGVTLAWQSHGDEAKEAVRSRAPSLAWLLPVSTTKPEGQVSPAAAMTSLELAQQLKPVALDLAVVRRSLEQVAARQEQMAQNIATLQAVELDISQKMPSQPPPQPPARKPPQSAARSSAMQSSSVPAPPPAQQPVR